MGSKTHRNLLDGGYTTHHSDGSTSRTYENVLDGGYTTYHSDGSTSRTYENVLDGGYTSYHSDGSTSRTYENVFDDGHTTYRSGSGSPAADGRHGASFDTGGAGAAVLGVFMLGITVICALTSLRFSFLPVVVIAASCGGALLLRKKLGEANGFLLMQPFLLYGFHCWYHTAWTNLQRQGFLTGLLAILGILVVEVLLELFILISKIGDEGNGFLFFLIGCAALGTLFGAFEPVFRIVYAIYSAILLLACLIVVIVRRSRPKGGQ